MWTLDKGDIDGETVKDVSGNGNDAKIVGTLKSAPGMINEALEFDGAGNYVELPELGAWEQGTIECWAQQTEAGGIQGIISTWQWAPGKVHFKFESNQIQVHKNDGVKVTFARELETWYHIIYTCDTKADELKLYVNGELAAEGKAGGELQVMNERRIGSEYDGRFLIGLVDEVRFYDRILTEDEVKKNFLAESNSLSVEPVDKIAASWGEIKER